MAFVPPQNPDPFQQIHRLNRDSSATLAIRHGIGDTRAEWDDYINSNLESKILDELYPSLWLVARKSGNHIDPLHLQLVKGRVIIITEDPKLHLVWFYGIIYIKPLPDYLLNYSIWRAHFPRPVDQPADTRPRYDKYRAALGFLRSYGFLIRHESDFIIAQRNNLLPKYVSFQRFQEFIRPFRLVQDDQVAHRYQYGQLRLTRLNWAVHVVKTYRTFTHFHNKHQLPWNYAEVFWQTSQYFRQYATPLIFVFALFSLVLSSMQVVLAALGDKAWGSFVRISWGFSVAILVFAVICITIAIISVVLVLMIQGQFAVRAKWKAERLGP